MAAKAELVATGEPVEGAALAALAMSARVVYLGSACQAPAAELDWAEASAGG